MLRRLATTRRPTLRTMRALPLVAAGLIALGVWCTSTGAQPPPPPTGMKPVKPPVVEALGADRYRIGRIKLDRRQRRFSVGGRILRHDPPLEFLVITRDGRKDYESLVAVDASAYDWNLACLLIGLDPDHARLPKMHFDPTPVEGDPVEIAVSWRHDGRVHVVDPAALVRLGDKHLPEGQWVYTGGLTMPDGRWLGGLDGTLVGFVHDPATVIEHRSGFLGAFDAVTPDRERLPPVGSRVQVSVRRPRGSAGAAGAATGATAGAAGAAADGAKRP